MIVRKFYVVEKVKFQERFDGVDRRLYPFLSKLSNKKGLELDKVYLKRTSDMAQGFGESGKRALDAIYGLYVLREFALLSHLPFKYSDLSKLYAHIRGELNDRSLPRYYETHLNNGETKNLIPIVKELLETLEHHETLSRFLDNMEGELSRIVPARILKTTWTFEEQLPFYIMERAWDSITREMQRNPIRLVPKE